MRLSVLHMRAHVDLEGGAVDGEMIRQQGADFGRHVAALIAGVVARDLLQRDQVGAAHGVDDARNVVFLVQTDTVLDVVGHAFHRFRPRAPRT